MKPIDTIVRQALTCQCGTITGYPCSYDLDGATAIPVVWVPEYLRGTATAAGNWGGVADDLVLSAECADDLVGDWIKVAQ